MFSQRLVPATEEVLAWVGRLPGPAAVTYEAGPTGFGLARAFAAAGARCGGGSLQAGAPHLGIG